MLRNFKRVKSCIVVLLGEAFYLSCCYIIVQRRMKIVKGIYNTGVLSLKSCLREGGFDKKKLKINIVFKSGPIHFPFTKAKRSSCFAIWTVFFMLGDIFGFFII